MKLALIIFLAISSPVYAQMTHASAREIIGKYSLGSSSYFEPFLEKEGYGAAWILTSDGGAAAFGSNMLYKFSKDGKEQWSKQVIPQFNEIETQAVAQDSKANLYVFMLSYDNKRYRGGSERVICYSKDGKLLWDKTLGAYTLINNPTVSYIKSQADGKIYMRGHIVTDEPKEDKDPDYKYWEGWIDSTGKLTQQIGEKIDWANQEWQKRFTPEESR